MSDAKNITTLFNAELPDSVDNAIKNLTDKPSSTIGSTISDLWYMIFGGISYAAEKRKIKYAHELEQYREELEQSIAQIPEAKRIEPSFQIAAQVLENSKYCVEEKELRTMFTSLISNSMNSDYSSDIHPSFAEIIKQMSILDAKIIKKFKTAPGGQYPLCDYHRKSNSPGYTVLHDNVFLELPVESLLSCSQSLSSLSRLGLIRIPDEVYIVGSNAYEHFEQHPFYKALKQKYPNDEIVVHKKHAHLTPLGRSFVKVYIPD